jgi:hypothetical protein
MNGHVILVDPRACVRAQRRKQRHRLKRFSRLRTQLARHETGARELMEWHVRRRFAAGWRVKTIAKKLGLSEVQVQIFLRPDTNVMAPRLVKRIEPLNNHRPKP